jgi:hypothetical protein
MKPDTWWKTYLNRSSEYRSIHRSDDSSALAFSMDKNPNESVLTLGTVNLKEPDAVEDESGFSWHIVTEVSQEVAKGRLPPDKPTDDSPVQDETQHGETTDEPGECVGYV